MTNNTPSSLICFKNGYSYVNIPVSLSPDPDSTSDSDIKECQVGPLPNFAVHGTVALAPHNPEEDELLGTLNVIDQIGLGSDIHRPINGAI